MEETLPDTGDFILLDLILLENISKIPKKKKRGKRRDRNVECSQFVVDLTINRIIKEGPFAIFALVTEDGATDQSICLSSINGCSKKDETCKKELL
jgi:hypothetical protein